MTNEEKEELYFELIESLDYVQKQFFVKSEITKPQHNEKLEIILNFDDELKKYWESLDYKDFKNRLKTIKGD